MRTMTRTLMGLVLALAIAAPAMAQDEGPLTWVAYTRVKPGKTQEWLKLELENGQALMDQLVADHHLDAHRFRRLHRRRE